MWATRLRWEVEEEYGGGRVVQRGDGVEGKVTLTRQKEGSMGREERVGRRRFEPAGGVVRKSSVHFIESTECTNLSPIRLYFK